MELSRNYRNLDISFHFHLPPELHPRNMDSEKGGHFWSQHLNQAAPEAGCVALTWLSCGAEHLEWESHLSLGSRTADEAPPAHS